MQPSYLAWLKQENAIRTIEGKHIDVFELVIEDDAAVLNNWAKHLREHYCLDSEIDDLRAGYGLERSEYLETIKFPDEHIRPGPSVRSGDFTEILIADYVEFVLNFMVPRTRYDRKINRNSSPMGSDIVGYKFGAMQSNRQPRRVLPS